MVLRSSYQPARASAWIAGKTGMRAVTLPYTVGSTERAGDLFALYEEILGRLAEAAP